MLHNFRSIGLLLGIFTCCYAEKPVPAPEQAYGHLPLIFERNQGQADVGVRFLARGQKYVIALTPGGVALRLKGAPDRKVQLNWAGAQASSRFDAQQPLPGVSNYLIGNNPCAWIQGVPQYGKVWQHDAYPGIDVAYYGTQGQLEYDFVLQPGADPDKIRLHITGANSLRLNSDGDLVLDVNGSDLRQKLPLAYQDRNGNRSSVRVGYRLLGKDMVGLMVSNYDRSRPLVIDPVLVLAYSTYLGGANMDQANGIAVDGSGNTWVAGSTTSVNFPLAGTGQAANGGGMDAFISKLDPTGTILLFSTYLGGSGNDQANGIAVDTNGNAYIAGSTTSPNFPTTATPLQVANAGVMNAFAVKLNATGAVVYSTYIGGNGSDSATGIAVDTNGAAYITGVTSSGNFPTTTGAAQLANGGGQDAFILKLNAAGNSLVYSTYLGGSGNEQANGIAVDTSLNAYVAGNTQSSNFPLTAPLYATYGGAGDAFVTKLNSSGQPVYSTYLGGSNADSANAIAVDSSGNAYVAGSTTSFNFPVMNAFQAQEADYTEWQGVYDAPDAFISKLNAAGTALVYSTYFGGYYTGAFFAQPGGYDAATGIAVDSAGNAYVTGHSNSASLPLQDPFQSYDGPTFEGTALYYHYDVFVASFSPVGALLYSTFLGGSEDDYGTAIAVDTTGAYIAGYSKSSDFPLQAPYQSSNASGSNYFYPGSNAVIAKLTFSTPGVRVFFGALPQSAPIAVSGTGCSAGSYVAANIGGFGTTQSGTPVVLQPAASCTVTVSTSAGVGGTRYAFSSWGDGPTANPRVIAAPAHGVDYVINLTPQYLLTTSASPVAGGTITVLPSSPDGYYSPGTVLTVTAVPNPGYALSSFSGSLTGATNGQSLTMSGPQIVTANFVPTSMATTTVLTSSLNPSTYGQSVTLTATVLPAGATGPVTFYDGTAVLDTKPLVSGLATLTTSLLPAGTQSLTAYYGGGGTYVASTSPALAQSVSAVAGNAFRVPVNYPIGNATAFPMQVAVGDFNGDSKPDLAVAVNSSVMVFLGNGDGTFQAEPSIAVGSASNAVAVGDFDGDGKADLVVGSGNGLLVFLGNGNGTFQPGVNYATGTNALSIAVGDFNGDGKADLVAADSSTSVNVFLGRGDGTFLPPVSYPTGSSPASVVLGDFNGDGKTDIAVANSGSNNVSILLGVGDGTFQPQVSYPVGNDPVSIATADFNGDGIADLVVANSSSNNVTVLLGNINGTFQTGSPYAAGAAPTSVSVADFNGDGKPDLVVTDSTGSSVSVLLNTGTGTFQPAVSYLAGASPYSVAAADFNGDGRADLAVGGQSGTLSVFLASSGATQLKFGSQVTNSVPGVALPSLTALVEDANGNVLDSSVAVSLTSNPAGINTAVNAVDGVATFTGLVFSAVGTYTLTAASPGLTSATSNSFNIVSAAPSVVIESPAPGAVLQAGPVAVSGWAIDNIAVAGTTIKSVQVLLDGAVVGNATYGLSRPDICTTYPGRPGCPNVGFSLVFSLPTGIHTITVTATDSDAVPDMGSASVTVTVQGPMTGTRVGVFRNNISFLEDSVGGEAYLAGVDRYIPSFTGPGGFMAGDVPVVGDWTGDGHAKVGIYRTSTGAWYLDANNDGVYNAGDYTYSFGGLPGDMPFVGDWNGVMGISTYKSCIGIYRSPQSQWLLDLNCNGVFDNTPTDAFFPFGGLAGDVPVVGNWTGTHTRVGVVRSYAPLGVPVGPPFFWVYDNSPANAGNLPANHQPAVNCFAFGGLPGDVFVTGDWYNTGTTTAGVYRSGYWVLDAALPGAPQANHINGLAFAYGGVAGDVPITGKW